MEITEHAVERAKERLGLNRDALTRTAQLALAHGVPHSATSGRLNRWITKLFFQNGTANNTRIYGEFVFLFTGVRLITVFRIPNDLKNAAAKARAKLNE
jgi:hypothetical protein